MSKQNNNIFLIDANAFCYRAFYAIKELFNSNGLPTNAVLGFINILRKLRKDYSPSFIGIVFDLKGPTKRHEKYEKYKLHRKPMPDGLIAQIPYIKKIVSAFNIPIYELQGYEADDIIATLARKASLKGYNVTIVTGDKDALQLVDGKIAVLSPDIKESKFYDSEKVREKFGVYPREMPEYMALAGDSSDNVPGVKGVGEETAKKLIAEYGTIENIYNNLEKISSESLREKLSRDREMAFLSRELVVLDTNVPIEYDFELMKIKEPDNNALRVLYKELEFHKLLHEITPLENSKQKFFEYSGLSGLKIIHEKLESSLCVAFRFILEPVYEKLTGIAFSLRDGESYLVKLSNSDLIGPGASKILNEIFNAPNIIKIGYNLKNDLLILDRFGVSIHGNVFDIMIADYLLEPSRANHDFDTISMKWLGCLPSSKSNGKLLCDAKGQALLNFDAPSDISSSFLEESALILKLYYKLCEELEFKKLSELFFDIEMPLVLVLKNMESRGVAIDASFLETLSSDISKKLDVIRDDIYKLAGEVFNINSPKQLQHILFEKLKLPSGKKTKTGISTDESVLLNLSLTHELPQSILNYRALNKIKTTYCDGILELIDKKRGTLHTHFNQTVTATGRLSSSEPNLQNIPIKTDLAREVRRAFIPGGKDKIFISADYSQIELRLLAHLSGDENLISAFRKGEDVHSFTASLIFNVSLDAVTSEMRATAKTVNFGIIYGMSSFGLSKDLGIKRESAESFINAYFDRYPGVKSFIDKTIISAREKGYVTTLFNRRRYMPEILSANEQVKSFAERACVNTPVQGGAADIIKLAMLKCENEFSGTEIEMVLQVHDELIFTSPGKDYIKTAKKIKNIMENIVELKVPLITNLEFGNNWLDMKEIEI
ncbi:DNA polymerase I [Candidatus Omnitrophus magneticus]|uniref:DNA polymerase I n=1 Tax=Candidatus Omnitrophus magneticus TaxID=1609969 RepID=A0A0F0CQU6_9BACT|nr:DNA polymerase I [Candidatus Omnitrophus magneticus]